VAAKVPSDPYLIGFYDKRSLTISHNSSTPVEFTIEAEPVGHGPWMIFKIVTVNPERYLNITSLQVLNPLIRFISSENCIATAHLKYE